MLTVYQPQKSEDYEESVKEKVIPAGAPYLTKVHGKLVMARQKKPKTANVAIDLLGEAFGSRSTILRKRSKSLDRTTKTPLLIANSPYIPQPQLTYTVPVQQKPFPQPSSIPMLQCQHPHPHPQPHPHPHPHPHMYSQNMVPMPQFPAQYPMQRLPQFPLSEPQRYSVPPSKPSEKDLEQLKSIDAHYKKVNPEKKEKTKRLSAGSAVSTIASEELPVKTNKTVPEFSASKTTITITKHVCANCGRLRSRKYHHEHPIKAGETPNPAFCRKCQKDASSTSGSDDDKGPNKKAKNVAKNKNVIENERLESADGPVLTDAKQSKAKKKEKKVLAPSHEYVIVEEEFPVDDRARRSYTRLRLQGSDVHLASPRAKWAQSFSEDEQPESPVFNEPERFQSEPKIQKYFHEPDVPAEKRGRRPTFTRSEEALYDPKPSPQVPYNEGLGLRMGSSENSFDTVGSLRSAESRRRRRVERAHPDITPDAPWDAPHVFHPQPSDEAIVVTERYVYRPKKHMKEQCRQQEHVDKRYFHSRDNSAELEEEASKYYHNDWSRAEPTPVREEPTHRETGRGGYCRDEIHDSEVAGSESSDYFRAEGAVFHDIPPRAPTPERDSSTTEAWPEVPPYQLSSDEETAQQVKSARRGKARRQKSPDQSSRHRDRSITTSSSYRPPLVREASEGGTEKALILSPLHSPRLGPSYGENYSYVPEQSHLGTEQVLVVSPKKRQQRASPYDDDDFSDMTERERIAERDTRRVTFQSPTPSPVASVSSFQSDYKTHATDSFLRRRIDATDSFLRKKTSWDDSDTAPRPPNSR